MAARITKLFLQNCAQSASASDSGKTKRSSASSGVGAAASGAKKGGNAQRKQKQKQKQKRAGKVAAGKPKERVLETARRELEQADRTRENLRKLKAKTSTKSQRVMAKALAQRMAAFR